MLRSPIDAHNAEGGQSIAPTGETLRIDAAFRLGASNDPAAMHPLCDCLSEEAEVEALRIACASALARLARAGTVACLARHAQHWSPTLRAHVRTSLERMREELPRREAELIKRARTVERRVEVEAELGDRATWLALRKDLVALRSELLDVQRQIDAMPELADAGP